MRSEKGGRRDRLDHIRIQGALSQPFGIRAFGRFLFEHLNKHAADDLTFGLWVGHSSQFTQKLIPGINDDQIGVKVAPKNLFNRLAFIVA